MYVQRNGLANTRLKYAMKFNSFVRKSSTEVNEPRRITFRDGFANDDGSVNTEFPSTTGIVTIEPIDAGHTRMSIESHFPSKEALEQILALGMEEGLTQAVGQIDAILAEQPVA